jgi:hypothetical protein
MRVGPNGAKILILCHDVILGKHIATLLDHLLAPYEFTIIESTEMGDG